MRAFALSLLLFVGLAAHADAQDAAALVLGALKQMRGQSSTCTLHMAIHNPHWERMMTIKAWTRGLDETLFRIILPKKDFGNGTLKKGKRMWTFNPKINRVIKIPPAMMSQAWMGSNFSYNDVSRTDEVYLGYRHTLIGTETRDEKKVYVIKCMPKNETPVPWGMLKLKIRQDHILLHEGFYDEDLKLVKTLSYSDIMMIGGRLVPTASKMQKAGDAANYTTLTFEGIVFDRRLPDGLFTMNALKNHRE
jgi:outer membrane lipoprotein-sorting protein